MANVYEPNLTPGPYKGVGGSKCHPLGFFPAFFVAVVFKGILYQCLSF